MPSLKKLGEFGLIERLARALPETALTRGASVTPRLLVGIGDDAAVWMPSPGARVVATTDALVEGVHFDLRFTGWRDLGWMALAANLSDAAAMGARPAFALVVLGVGPGRAVEDFEELYAGMGALAQQFGVSVVGGDVVSAPVTFLSIALYAEAGEQMLRRDSARPGDVLAVTGTLGDSAAGLRLLQERVRLDTSDRQTLVERHNRPVPRVREAALLLEEGLRCGMDLSDGLLGDAERLARASGVEVNLRLHCLPISAALKRVFPGEAYDFALGGGEDYELLVAGPAPIVERSGVRLQRDLAMSLTVVGDVGVPANESEAVVVWLLL